MPIRPSLMKSVLLGCLAITLGVTVACRGMAGPIARDLVAYYSFDDAAGEVLKEGTGNGTDGELFNFDFENDSNWTNGQIGGALEFDGVDDHVIVPEYQLAETGLSLSMWAQADSAPTWASLVKNCGDTIVGQFHFGLGPGGADTLNIFITDGDGSAFNAGTDIDVLPLEEWVHVAAKYLTGQAATWGDGDWNGAPGGAQGSLRLATLCSINWISSRRWAKEST